MCSRFYIFVCLLLLVKSKNVSKEAKINYKLITKLYLKKYKQIRQIFFVI